MRTGEAFAFPAALCALLTAAAEARASDDAGAYVNPGILYAPTYGKLSGRGLGGELSFVVYPDGCCRGYGGVFQVEQQTATVEGHPGERSFMRYAAGFQANAHVIGMEAGWAYRSGDGDLAWGSGPHVGFFFSIGQGSIGVRFTLPVVHGTGDAPPSDTALVWTLKLPFLVYGEDPRLGKAVFGDFPNMRMPSGRPLSVNGAATIAPVRRGAWGARAELTTITEGGHRRSLLDRLLGVVIP
jgi:hypothetical protein